MENKSTQQSKSLIYAYIDHQVENAIDNNLISFLNDIKKNSLFLNLSYIIKELVANAYKANLKRVHFKLNNLDINSTDAYKIGIKSFKENFKDLDSNLFREARSLRSYIKIDMNVANNNLVISIMNNTPIIKIEKERILNKIQNARVINDLEEAITKVIDREEGSGLGLIIVLLTLKKIGVNEHGFEVLTSENNTEIRIKIPLNIVGKFEEEIISETAVKLIDEIPPFPQHIIDLQKNLSDPNANFKDLIRIIIKDPPLIVKVLKIANSSYYMLPKKIKTVEEAVRIIGFEGIKNIVFAYNIENLISNSKKIKLQSIQNNIQHSLEVAYYSFHLAKHFKYNESYTEVYIAGTLHDIGKIIIDSINPDIFKKINQICYERGIQPDRLENVTMGLNHSIVGAEVAKKWNFPDYIVDVIKNHHTPMNSFNPNSKVLLYIIYLGNLLYYYKRARYDFRKIDFEVLKFFNLTNKTNLEYLFDHLINRL